MSEPWGFNRSKLSPSETSFCRAVLLQHELCATPPRPLTLPRKMSILSIGKKGMDTLSKVMPDVWERGIMNDMKQAMSFQFAAYVVDHIKSFEWDRYAKSICLLLVPSTEAVDGASCFVN